MAGIPGTGLGGVFYVLLIIWIAAREAWRLATGASRYARWIKVMKLSCLAAAIVGALWLESWFLTHLLGPLPNVLTASNTSQVTMSAVAPSLTIAPFLILALLMFAMHVARIFLVRNKNSVDKSSLERSALGLAEELEEIARTSNLSARKAA